MQDCPYCSNKPLRHIKGGAVYWFCRSCWQEVPSFQSQNKHAPIALK